MPKKAKIGSIAEMVANEPERIERAQQLYRKHDNRNALMKDKAQETRIYSWNFGGIADYFEARFIPTSDAKKLDASVLEIEYLSGPGAAIGGLFHPENIRQIDLKGALGGCLHIRLPHGVTLEVRASGGMDGMSPLYLAFEDD